MMGVSSGFSIGNHAYDVVTVCAIGTICFVEHTVVLLFRQVRGNVFKHLPYNLLINLLGPA